MRRRGILPLPLRIGNMTPRYSITTDLVDQHSDQTREFAAFAAAGFTHVHWCQHWAGEPVFYDQDFIDGVRALADRHGLQIADIHGYSGVLGKRLRYTDELFLAVNLNRIDFAAAVGAQALVLHLPLRKFDVEAAAVEHSVAMVRALLPAARAAGVRPAIENLGQERSFLRSVLEAFAPEDVGFCYDSGHANFTGQADLVRLWAPRLICTHLHDNDGKTDQHRLPGEGTADWPMIVRALRDGGYQGTWNLELFAKKEMTLEEFCTVAFATVQGLGTRA